MDPNSCAKMTMIHVSDGYQPSITTKNRRIMKEWIDMARAKGWSCKDDRCTTFQSPDGVAPMGLLSWWDELHIICYRS